MNLIEEAEALMLHQFTNSPKLKGLIRTLIGPLQEVFELIKKLHHGNYIDNAHDQRLEVLGDIVAQPRRGMNDSDFRAWVDVGIKLNHGSGTPENVLTILKILYRNNPEFLMHEHSNDVVFTLFKRPMSPIKAALNIVQSATPITTTCHFICADGAPSFRFDNTSFAQSTWAEFYEENL